MAAGWVLSNALFDGKLGSAKPRWDVEAQTLHHFAAQGRAKPQPSVLHQLQGVVNKKKMLFCSS